MLRSRAFHIVVVAAALTSASAHSTADVSKESADSAAASEHVVRIDAIVSDARGRPIDTLTAKDFELTEDGTPRVVDNVTFVRPSAAQGRRFGIFLDEYYVNAGSASARVRDAITRFVDRALAPDDLIVVMKPLDSLLDIRLTSDRDAARRSIAAFEGRRGDYVPRNNYEQNYIAGDPAQIERARMQVTIATVNAMAQRLGRTSDGRKTLIVVTQALGPPPRSRGREYLTTLETAIGTANRGHVSVYTVDPGVPASGDAVDSTSERAVRALAEGTDGQVIVGAELDAGLARAADDSAGYYLLTYRSAHTEDGRFHPVDVRVKRPAQVRARSGYWAPSPDDALQARLLARNAEPKAAQIEPARHISPLIRTWFGTSRGESGKTRVMFVWEPAERIPGDRVRRSPPASLDLTVLTADQRVVFQGTVQRSGPTAADEQAGPRSRAVFDAAPGRLRLQMKITDETAAPLDLDVRDIAVRDWRGAVAIGTPEVFRARTARDFRALAADPDATPVVSRDFSRAERLLIRVPIYTQSTELTVSADLLGRSGQPIRPLLVDPSPVAGTYRIDLPLSALAPGDYAIEVTGTGSSGEAKERLEFRVTN